MKRIIIASMAALALLTSCNETDIDLFDSPSSDAGHGTLASSDVTVSKLDFSWSPVDGVHQYGYLLTDPDGNAVRQGVTKATYLHFENLEPSTLYTLSIEAYGHNGSPTTRFTLQASTAAIVTLATPDIAATTTSIDNGRVIITWPAVDNAEYYTYSLEKADGTEIFADETTDNFVTFNSMPIGDYVLRITAYSEQEGYLPSETAAYSFHRDRQIVEIHQGTYKSAVLGDFSCTMNVYDDGANVIEAFLGVDGYNLEFSVDADKSVSILNYFDEYGSFKYVATGIDGNDTLTIYQDPAYCTYSVLPTGKRIKLYVYLGDATDGAYDTFTWK